VAAKNAISDVFGKIGEGMTTRWIAETFPHPCTYVPALASDPRGAFDKHWEANTSHVLFKHPESQLPKYHGIWLTRNYEELRQFVCDAPGSTCAALIPEVILTSKKGKNAGLPDLIAWTEDDFLFAEVKVDDRLSIAQRDWIAAHQTDYRIELVRVRAQTTAQTDS
jgi:hypothetical protein